MRRAATASATSSSALAERISRLPAAEREEAVVEIVRSQLAAVLGLVSPELVPIDRPLQELGLDSLMAVEARNRLSQVVGKKIPTSLIFDQPTVRKMSKWLSVQLLSENGRTGPEEHFITVLSRAIANSSIVRLREVGILDGLCRIANVSEPVLEYSVAESPAVSPQVFDAHNVDETIDDLTRALESFDE
jgi:polyketide synthase 12